MHISTDLERPSCISDGAEMVREAKSKTDGQAVPLAYFRFPQSAKLFIGRGIKASGITYHPQPWKMVGPATAYKDFIRRRSFGVGRANDSQEGGYSQRASDCVPASPAPHCSTTSWPSLLSHRRR